MICYMLITNMPLWITVYLRNKWCLNLESWKQMKQCSFGEHISHSVPLDFTNFMFADLPNKNSALICQNSWSQTFRKTWYETISSIPGYMIITLIKCCQYIILLDIHAWNWWVTQNHDDAINYCRNPTHNGSLFSISYLHFVNIITIRNMLLTHHELANDLMEISLRFSCLLKRTRLKYQYTCALCLSGVSSTHIAFVSMASDWLCNNRQFTRPSIAKSCHDI